MNSKNKKDEIKMPIYEYRCKNCHQDSEAFQGIKDLPFLQCKACGQDALERLMSAAGFRLKGGGWYETDFKTSAEKQKNLTENQTEKTEAAAVKTPLTEATGTAQRPVSTNDSVASSSTEN